VIHVVRHNAPPSGNSRRWLSPSSCETTAEMSTTQTEIRRATTSDIPEIAQMTVALAAETEGKPGINSVEIEQHISVFVESTKPFPCYLVATENDRMVGQLFLWLQPFPMIGGHAIFFDDWYVVRNRRGNGICSSLFNYVRNHLIQANPAIVCGRLVVKESNAARKQYSHFGFEKSSIMMEFLE